MDDEKVYKQIERMRATMKVSRIIFPTPFKRGFGIFPVLLNLIMTELRIEWKKIRKTIVL